MYYVIEGIDRPDNRMRREAARPAHLERARLLLEEGRLLLVGPLPAIDAADPGPAGVTGSLMVAEFESLDGARTWIDADPYVVEGVFASVTVRRFRKVLP